MKKKDIADHFDIKPQTLSDIIKSREKIETSFLNFSVAGVIKRLKTSKYEKTAQELFQWFTDMQTSRTHAPINDEIIKLQATELVRKLGELTNDKEFDMNWIYR